jgi:hypothetical protein
MKKINSFMNTKIEEFIRRSRYRNPHLYNDKAEEGYDYVVCPVSMARMIMIKSSYIERILGMTVEEYDNKYPGVQKIAESRKTNISKGLQQKDPATGKTKYELSQEKARVKLASIGSDGLTGYERKGLQTRATHMSNIDEMGRNGYSQIATKAILKGNKTKADRGLITADECKDEFRRYKTIVWYLTNKHRVEITKGYKTGLAGTVGAYHIDHMFSVVEGYKRRVSPLVISHRSNLTMLEWKSNIKKHASCSITLSELLLLTQYSSTDSEEEFDIFVKLINEDIINKIPPNAAFLLERYYETVLR